MQEEDPNETRRRINRERQRRLRARQAEARAAEAAAAEAANLAAEINARGRGRGRGRGGTGTGRGGTGTGGGAVARGDGGVGRGGVGSRGRGRGRGLHVVNNTGIIANAGNSGQLAAESAQTPFLRPIDDSGTVNDPPSHDGTPLSNWSATPDAQLQAAQVANAEGSQLIVISTAAPAATHTPQYGLDYGRLGREGPCALDVVLAWMATQGNLARFRISDVTTKRLLALEIIQKLRQHGMSERTPDSVVDKVRFLKCVMLVVSFQLTLLRRICDRLMTVGVEVAKLLIPCEIAPVKG